MAGNHKRRKRFVDVAQMSAEQRTKLEEQMGKELAKIFDEANSKANKLLNIYGLQTKIVYQIEKLEQKKRAKKKKASEQQSLS